MTYGPSHIQPELGDWRERRNSNARAQLWSPLSTLDTVPQLLRRIFALCGHAPSPPPALRRCCRSEPRQEATRTQAPLAPSPSRGDLAQNGAQPRAHPAVNKNPHGPQELATRQLVPYIVCDGQ
jgi:hypothetical protein